MTDTLGKDAFWTNIDAVQAGMLSIDGARPVPMSQYADEEENALWFITAHGTDAEEALRGGARQARFVVAEGDARIYATIDGTIGIVDDTKKLDEIWNIVADSWFEDGKSDPDVTLLRFDLSEAEVWTTGGRIGFLYEIGKAQMSDHKPEMGAHGRLSFAA